MPAAAAGPRRSSRVVVLLALAAPARRSSSASRTPATTRRGTTTRQAYDAASRDGFGPGANGPLMLVSSTARPRRRGAGSPRSCSATPGIAVGDAAAVQPRGRHGDRAGHADAPPRRRHATAALVERLRDGRLPAAGVPVLIGGRTAEAIDQASTTKARLPLFIGGVVGLSLLLLLTAFRSVIVADQGGGDEPAHRRRRLRRGDAPVQRRLRSASWSGSTRQTPVAAVHPGDHVRGPLRPVDGLRGVPALAHPRGVAAQRRHRRSGDRGPGRARRG